VDTDASSVSFFQGSKANPYSLNSGVARVTGKVAIDINHPDNSVFDLAMYPSDEDWDHALSSAGSVPQHYVPDASAHTLLTFKSSRVLRTKDGKLEVMGNLTLTRVERSVEATPSEAYAGPIYGDPVIHSETREITFRFPSLSVGPGYLTPATLKKKAAPALSGSTRVSYEYFPELLSAIQETNWPRVVSHEVCGVTSSVGEDYSGIDCTGTVIAATNDDNCHMPAVVGEDFSGAICTPPAGDQTTIVLNLKLLPGVFQPSNANASGKDHDSTAIPPGEF
jgi:polyisoprenoid-binding protein YceI